MFAPTAVTSAASPAHSSGSTSIVMLCSICSGMAGATFLADADEIRPQYQNGEDASAVFASSLSRDLGPSIGSTIDQMDAQTVTSVGRTSEEVAPWYSDQVLPFDVTLAGANEYGAMACAKIFGMEILNEGSGVSIDDAVTEMQATFVARAVEPMTAVQGAVP